MNSNTRNTAISLYGTEHGHAPLTREMFDNPTSAPSNRAKRYWRPIWVIACLATIVFLVEFGLVLNDVPLSTTIQSSLCNSEYDTNAIEAQPELCNSVIVQGGVNHITMLNGIASTLPSKLYHTHNPHPCNGAGILSIVLQQFSPHFFMGLPSTALGGNRFSS